MEYSGYEQAFKKIIGKKHGRGVDFGKVEIKLGHLRNGVALRYEDLLTIGDNACWPFGKYWMWPAKDQIDDLLKGTGDCFSHLPSNEEAIITKLNGIFRNIALVSIILRFVCPEYYAIYSRPPLKALRIERGRDDTEEYMQYIRIMRMLRGSYRVKRTADVDLIIWAIAHRENRENAELLQMIADNMPEKLTPKELIDYYAYNPLKIAEIYHEKNDYKTAGYWASVSFEQWLNNMCPSYMNAYEKQSDCIINKVKELCGKSEYKNEYARIDRTRKLRNRAIHPDEEFYPEDCQKIIDNMKILKTGFRKSRPEF